MIPRDEMKAREKLLADCKIPEFARLARYTKPIEDGSGDTVTRASVKFVERALARWGNTKTQNIIISDDAKARTVRVVLTDLESGNEYSRELFLEKVAERVKARPCEKVLGTRYADGRQVLLVDATEDDLSAKESDLTSRVVRQLGLRIIPAELVAECMDVVSATLGEDNEEPQPQPQAGQVHPEESRSSALAGLLKSRKGNRIGDAAPKPQSGTQAQITVPCAHCERPIYRDGKVWKHTNGKRACEVGKRARNAKPKAVQQ